MPPDRDLDRELRDLGPHVEYPPAPDLSRSVRSRLEGEGTGSPARTRPQVWWIAAAALLLLVAVPVVSLAVGGTGGGASSSAGGGVAMEPGGQEAGDAAGPTRLVEEDEPLAAGAGEETQAGEMQESIIAGGETGRPNSRVPDVVGMELIAACEKLSAKKYVGNVIQALDEPGARPGVVVEQRPLAGRKGYGGRPVHLTVSKPYPEDELQRLSRGRGPACLDSTG